MKIFFTCSFLLWASWACQAQGQQAPEKPKEMKTVFGRNTAIGGFVGLGAKPALINDQPSWMSGGSLAMVFGHAFNFGVAAYGTVNPVRSNYVDPLGRREYCRMGYGGILLEPVIAPRSVVHLSFPVLLGAGAAGYYMPGRYDPWFWPEEEQYRNTEFFFIAEPGMNIEVNLFRWLRLHAGAGYRFTGDYHRSHNTGINFSGWNGSIGIKAGWF